MSEKLDSLRALLRSYGSVVVGLSGGVDSALLAFVANEQLSRDNALAVTAVSPSLSSSEWDDVAALAREWGLNWEFVKTRELDNPDYVNNDASRCSHCKDALMNELSPLAQARKAVILLGVNADDMKDEFRPGQATAGVRGARFPLAEVGLSKVEVRDEARSLGLRVWDRPAAPCLASRIPFGTPVTVSVLSSIERAESAIRNLGFNDLRVRHYGTTARIELDEMSLERAIAFRSEIVRSVKSAGYKYVTLDLEGLRSGNLNASSARGD